MRKKLLAFLLAAVLAAGLLPETAFAANASGYCGDDVTWSYSGGVLTIQGTGRMNDYCYYDTSGYVAQPWSDYRGEIRAVRIEDGVTSIGNSAFSECGSLTEAIIPDSVTAIGDSAFFGCGLTRVTIPNGVTAIGDAAFYGCDLTRVIIPGSVTTIGDAAFANCGSLTRAIIPGSITAIGNSTFSWCSALTRVIIPGSVTTIGEAAFHGCGSLTGVTIPSGVTTIGRGAFNLCGSLTGVTIPDSVTAIEEHAFEGCISLTEIYYGGSESQWERIKVKDGNQALTGAVIYCDGAMPAIPAGSRTPDVPFTDVPADQYYAPAVAWGVDMGYVSGTSATTFSPQSPYTRGQIVTILWRAYGQPEPTSDENPFTDVRENEYYYKAVLWAVENGITQGASATAFNPGGICTQSQAITFQYRAAGEPSVAGGSSFPGVPENEWYANAVAWAVDYNIISAAGGDQFSPGSTCTRANGVTFLYKDPVVGG